MERQPTRHRTSNVVILVACLTGLAGALQPTRPCAAEGSRWVLEEIRIVPPNGSLEWKLRHESHSAKVTPASIQHSWTRSDWEITDSGQVQRTHRCDFLFRFDVPETLTPGDNAEIRATIEGKLTGETLPTMLYYHDTVGWRLRQTDPERMVRAVQGFQNGMSFQASGPVSEPIHRSDSLKFLPPEAESGKLIIEARIRTRLINPLEKVAGINWIYGVGVGAGVERLTLTHYPPLDHFQAGTGLRYEPAGDIVATLEDGQGKPIEGKLVVFYVDPEAPATNEPGKNFHAVIPLHQTSMKPPVHIEDQPPQRKYLGWSWTDSKGEARINTIRSNLIDGRLFADELVYQTFNFEGRGKVSATVSAAVYDRQTQSLARESSVEVAFTAMAKLLKIHGKGRPDDQPRYADCPGRVRLKRLIALPRIEEWKVIDEGCLLMPGDILDIDGNAAVEVAWVTGDRVTAKVPGTVTFSDTDPIQIPHARTILLSSAYDSGFRTTGEKIKAALFGFGGEKGVKWLIESIPVLGKAATIGSDVYQAIEKEVRDVDFSKIGITTKIRVRSRVIVDNTGDKVKIYTVEGRPEVKTEAGRVTLDSMKMVGVADDGSLTPVRNFEAASVERDFYEAPPYISRPTARSSNAVSSAEAGGKSASQPSFDIPSLTANVVAFRFFEGPSKAPPGDKRRFARTFDAPSTRYIYWHMKLEYPKRKTRTEFDVEAVWYDPDGTVFGRYPHHCRMEEGWSASYYTRGRGPTKGGTWKPGVYRAEVYLNGDVIAAGSFRITSGRGGEKGGAGKEDVPVLAFSVWPPEHKLNVALSRLNRAIAEADGERRTGYTRARQSVEAARDQYLRYRGPEGPLFLGSTDPADCPYGLMKVLRICAEDLEQTQANWMIAPRPPGMTKAAVQAESDAIEAAVRAMEEAVRKVAAHRGWVTHEGPDGVVVRAPGSFMRSETDNWPLVLEAKDIRGQLEKAVLGKWREKSHDVSERELHERAIAGERKQHSTFRGLQSWQHWPGIPGHWFSYRYDWEGQECKALIYQRSLGTRRWELRYVTLSASFDIEECEEIVRSIDLQP